ncbi:MAG: efflux RND transporter periplasmic adaptor subunit [Zoogloeaceae bacterium]|jgi:membrane fusion protein (multidrug efflux system)|nr:efflux RND transporter periplasmic adaptor subunit [Zoogloeaceae bacterium]
METKKGHHNGVILLALAGLAALGGGGYWLHRMDGQRLPEATALAASRNGGGDVLVETARAARTRLADEATAVGTLKSNESVVLRPETSGRINRIAFQDGERVKKGALLLTLDAGIQAAELQQAEANLSLARANQSRNEDLFRKKFISPQALDNTRAALRVQEAAVTLARARLDKMRIRAPFDGVVGIRNVSVGDYVREGEDLVNLEDTNTLKVDFRLPEAYLNRLRAGLDLEVMSDALPNERFSASLTALDPLVDVGGRSISCRALLPNGEGRLHPGMFVRVRLDFGANVDVLMIPEEAVVMDSPPFVFRIETHGERLTVKSTPVRLGQHRAGQVEILEGLESNAEVVISGHLKLQDGAIVRRQEA